MSGEDSPHQDAPRILLVEDNEIVQAVTKMLLNNAGFQVDVQAFCGKAGMQGVLSKPISPQQIKDVWRKYGKGEEIVVEGLTLLIG